MIDTEKLRESLCDDYTAGFSQSLVDTFEMIQLLDELERARHERVRLLEVLRAARFQCQDLPHKTQKGLIDSVDACADIEPEVKDV